VSRKHPKMPQMIKQDYM